MSEKPHGANLRKGRISLPGVCYFITTNVERGRPPIPFPAGAELIIESLRWLRDEGRVWRAGYVIMNDHTHFMIVLRGEHTLASALRSLKTFTAQRINSLLGRAGAYWQAGYYDHAIRDEPDFWTRLNYMHNNPVRRHLVERAEEYAYSTAHSSRAGDIDWAALGYT